MTEPTRQDYEDAARAAGLICGTVRDDGVCMLFDGKEHIWRPLTDRSDSHRLMEDCRMRIKPGRGVWQAWADGEVNSSEYSALNEAIFWAAVASGRGKREQI